jgi:hypothetical protein
MEIPLKMGPPSRCSTARLGRLGDGSFSPHKGSKCLGDRSPPSLHQQTDRERKTNRRSDISELSIRFVRDFGDRGRRPGGWDGGA